jgi:hypothetical protein
MAVTISGTNGIAYTGGIVSKVVLNTSAQTTNNSNTLVELSTSYRLSYTPKYSTSKLLLEATWSMNTTTSNIFVFKFYDVTNAADVGVGDASGSRRRVGMAIRGAGTDANDAEPVMLRAYVDATNTTARTYTIYGSHENTGSGVAYINYSNGDSSAYGFATPLIFTITEIAQ